MRIMFFIPRMGSGGAERVISILANEFSIRGETVQISQLIQSESFYSLEDNILLTGMNISIRRNNKMIAYLDQARFFFKGIRYILTEIKQFQPDVVISFMRQTCIMMWVARLLGCKTKLICSERNDPTVQNRIIKKLMKSVYRSSDLLVCQGKGVYDYFDNVHNKAIIPNPVVDHSYLYKSIEERRNLICSVGRLDKQKNFPLLIRSFVKVHESFSEYKLEIYGEGPERQNLTNIIRDLHADKYISLMGAQKDVLERVADGAVFVMSSNYEGFPNALAEAMSVGVPVVSTDFLTGTARDMIGKNCGIIVPVNDQDSMTGAITQLLENEKLREMMAKECLGISKKYSTDNIIQAWDHAIKALLD